MTPARMCAVCKAILAESEGRLCVSCFGVQRRFEIDDLLRGAGFVVAWRPRRGPARWWRHRLYSREYAQEEAIQIALRETGA